jgi:hypothetical protein
MTASTQENFDRFDSLHNPEQSLFVLEILKRLVNFDFPPLTDEDLALNAEELLLSLNQ